MPSREAEKYIRQELARARYLRRRFCLKARAYKIKYYLLFAAYLLTLALLLGSAFGNLFAIALLGLIGQICFWAGVFYWTRYRDMNGKK